MMLYLRLAWRNIWRHRRRTVIVVIAMAMSLWMMMFYDGFVAGFNNAIYGNAIKFLGGNIQIHAEGYSENSSKTPLLPLADDQAAGGCRSCTFPTSWLLRAGSIPVAWQPPAREHSLSASPGSNPKRSCRSACRPRTSPPGVISQPTIWTAS